MRLLDLNLLRFGHFTDYVLDFETESANLHVIFGSNEAGKSTTLRAVLGLLFGIPERTQDHYVHDMQDLRIGARLENRTGEQLQVVRRKGRKDTLQEPNGQPVSDAVLNRFLGGVNRELFETMFGLSHEALVQGGQDLLEGRGEVGESLFGAGLGVRDIHAMRTALQKEASEIFAPRAQNPPLNKALKAFDEARKQANQLALKPRAWQDLQEQRQEAQQQLEEREQQHRQNLAELHRLQRLQRVLPRMRAREELLVAKQALDEVKLVPESCTQERTQAQQSWRNADVQERKRLDEQARSEQERAALQVPETLLARETAIEDLQKQLGAYLKAARDVPGLEAQIIAAREETQGILRELGRDETPEEAESLRIDVATQKRIHRLGQEGTRLEGELSRARKDVVGIDKKRRELQERLDELPPERDASALSQALAEFRRRGDLEAQVRALQTESAGIREKANKQLAALLLWQGPLEQVAELPLPLAETVDRFRGEFDTLANEQRLVQTQQDTLRKQLEDIVARIAVLEGRGTVPSEAEWEDARASRDTGWSQIRAVWLEGETEQQPPERLASDYEQQVRQADEVAERLWRDADRAAKHSTLSAERQRHEAEGGRLEKRLAELAEQEREQEKRWHDLWQAAGIDSLPPAEMRSWLGRHDKLVEVIAQYRDRERARDAWLSEIEEQRARCNRELSQLNEPVAAADESLNTLLHRAETRVKELETLHDTHRQIRRDLQKADKEQREYKQVLDQCEQALADWRQQWEWVVRPLGLGVDATSEEAYAILDGLARLFQKLKEAQDKQYRIEHIDRDAQQFAEQVADLVQTCAPDLQGAPADEVAATLAARLKQGKDDRKDRHNLDKRLKQIRKELDDLRREREAAQAELERLMSEADVETPEELEVAEQRSKEWRDLSAKLNGIEASLRDEGVPLEELVTQAQAVDPDWLPAEIPRLEATTEALGKDCAERREALWGLQKELETMDGRSQAADAAATAQESLAEIKTQVENYARLKLSALLLGREIERYREQNQGPIIRRAGEFFRQMTLERFAELSTGFAEGDKMVLLCVRDNGQRVPVEGLSEGTRDQLYLALRLASLEQQAARSEPTPLVVDDILINFDDRRARATLALLGELSEQTQVLFFTHHRQLLALAREAVPDGRLKEHDLDGVGLGAPPLSRAAAIP